MNRKLKWGLALIAVIALATLGYVVAGPYLAINGIRHLVAEKRAGELPLFVDFAELRASIDPQIRERIARGILARTGSSQKPQTIAEVVELIGKPAIDAIASPAGIDRLLVGDTLRPAGMAANAPFDPLASAQTRFESASLFTASVPNAQGKPLVFEFRRDGLSWKLTGLRLPEN